MTDVKVTESERLIWWYAQVIRNLMLNTGKHLDSKNAFFHFKKPFTISSSKPIFLIFFLSSFPEMLHFFSWQCENKLIYLFCFPFPTPINVVPQNILRVHKIIQFSQTISQKVWTITAQPILMYSLCCQKYF